MCLTFPYALNSGSLKVADDSKSTAYPITPSRHVRISRRALGGSPTSFLLALARSDHLPTSKHLITASGSIQEPWKHTVTFPTPFSFLTSFLNLTNHYLSRQPPFLKITVTTQQSKYSFTFLRACPHHSFVFLTENK
jgi:hypothetical protein